MRLEERKTGWENRREKYRGTEDAEAGEKRRGGCDETRGREDEKNRGTGEESVEM